MFVLSNKSLIIGEVESFFDLGSTIIGEPKPRFVKALSEVRLYHLDLWIYIPPLKKWKRFEQGVHCLYTYSVLLTFQDIALVLYFELPFHNHIKIK